MLAYGDWVEEEVLLPVHHRQYVFTVLKLLRPHFHQHHRLGVFCRIVTRLLNEAYGEAAPRGKPGFILFVLTFFDLPCAYSRASSRWCILQFGRFPRPAIDSRNITGRVVASFHAG